MIQLLSIRSLLKESLWSQIYFIPFNFKLRAYNANKNNLKCNPTAVISFNYYKCSCIRREPTLDCINEAFGRFTQ